MPHPCDIPASETCEAFKCPSWMSKQPWPIGDEACRTYLRDKRYGNLTTAEEMQQVERRQQDLASRLQAETASRQEEERASRDRQALNQSLQQQQQADEDRQQQLARNKKIVVVGITVLSVIALGSFFLRRFSA